MRLTDNLAKRTLIALAIVAALLVAAGFALSRLVESRILDLLGNDGSARTIHVGFKQIVLSGVVLGAPADWPADKSLRADSVVLVPQWRSLFSGRTVLESVRINGYSLAIWRRSGGHLDLLPTLQRHAQEREQIDQASHASAHRTDLGQVIFENGSIDFYDSTIARRPYHLVLSQIAATVGPMSFPHSSIRTNLNIVGQVGQGRSSGKTDIKGWIILQDRDADVRTSLRKVPIALIQPYLRKSNSLAFSGGFLDLDMHTQVQNQRLNASGRATLSDLKLKDENSLLTIPRKIMLAALEDNKGQASFAFTLSGDLNHPKFETQDSTSVKIAGGLASALGISIQGLVEGIGSTIEGFGGALTDLLPDSINPSPKGAK